MNETSMSMNFFEIFSCHMSKAKWLFFNCIWYTISLKIKESTINKELLFTSSYFMQRVKRWPQKQPCRKLCVAFDMYWNWMFFFLLLHTLTFTLNSFMECAKKVPYNAWMEQQFDIMFFWNIEPFNGISLPFTRMKSCLNIYFCTQRILYGEWTYVESWVEHRFIYDFRIRCLLKFDDVTLFKLSYFNLNTEHFH